MFALPDPEGVHHGATGRHGSGDALVRGVRVGLLALRLVEERTARLLTGFRHAAGHRAAGRRGEGHTASVTA
ncbi:hypothetical protein GCM10010398_68200 [Streptomyces fimbriatus]